MGKDDEDRFTIRVTRKDPELARALMCGDWMATSEQIAEHELICPDCKKRSPDATNCIHRSYDNYGKITDSDTRESAYFSILANLSKRYGFKISRMEVAHGETGYTVVEDEDGKLVIYRRDFIMEIDQK